MRTNRMFSRRLRLGWVLCCVAVAGSASLISYLLYPRQNLDADHSPHSASYIYEAFSVLEIQGGYIAVLFALILLFYTAFALLLSRVVRRWLLTPVRTLYERLLCGLPPGYHHHLPLSDELAQLSQLITDHQDYVASILQSQREFNDNLHHEIRHPLSIIRSDAEVILRYDNVSDTTRMRLERVILSVQEITQSLESIYQLYYAYPVANTSRLSLYDCMEQAITLQADAAARAGLTIQNMIDRAQYECINQHAFITVVRNILSNAIVHAAPATLTIQSLSHGVQFMDNGPGIPPESLTSIFHRHASLTVKTPSPDDDAVIDHLAAKSHVPLQARGLGLAIAQRICELQFWELRVQSPVKEGKGTCFSLYFNDHAHTSR